MRRRRVGYACALSAWALVASSAGAVPPLRATAFGTVEIEPTKVTGVFWLERDIIEAKEPIDRDGDMLYNAGELMAARGPITNYLNGQFYLLWDGKIHPIVVRDITTEKRRGLKYDYLKIVWVSRDSPNGATVSIVSRLLTEAWREARTMLNLRFGNRREIWVLSPGDYFDASLMGQPPPARAHSSRPRERRFACLNLCLAVELREGATKCPKCGSFIAELRGAGVPGANLVGLHGGPLMSMGPGGKKLEALLASKEELRVYLTDDDLNKISLVKAKGSVDLWTDEMMENTLVKVDLVPAPSGDYLAARIPGNMIMPLQARCTLNLGDGPAYLVDFFLPEIVEVTD
ncbi:MAG TPA: hypothetical protein VJZ71_14200 [Phycisphaerae bacterium]|nr:hypothetical protein [Phycisphaerae bacterium]